MYIVRVVDQHVGLGSYDASMFYSNNITVSAGMCHLA